MGSYLKAILGQVRVSNEYARTVPIVEMQKNSEYMKFDMMH